MNHPDLRSNTFGTGYDATTGTSPSRVRGSHGTACAGIIGAVQDNDLGISGVAPESDIVSISIRLMIGDTPLQLARGFDWARLNGVDVISNSWGGYAPSDRLTGAIRNAISNGRNGKGCVVVFATGNDNANILYPANSIPEILAVGAISPCAERKNPNSCDGENWWGSNFGRQLDVVAPGVLIPTTDRQGSNGYSHHFRFPETNPNYFNFPDYYSKFNGTSAACPHVAGVAALILSVNPDLTVQEVNDIIERTAQKVGGYAYNRTANRNNGRWHREMGYGLVDAHAAVLEAVFNRIRLSGPSSICLSGTATYSLSNVPNGARVWWSHTRNFNRIRTSGNSITVRHINDKGGRIVAWVNFEGRWKFIGGRTVNIRSKPKIYLHELSGPEPNTIDLEMVSTTSTNIRDQGITSTSWRKIHNGGSCYVYVGGRGFEGFVRGAHEDCTSWSVTVGASATNACGTTTISQWYWRVQPTSEGECTIREFGLVSNSKDNYEIVMAVNPCNEDEPSNPPSGGSGSGEQGPSDMPSSPEGGVPVPNGVSLTFSLSAEDKIHIEVFEYNTGQFILETDNSIFDLSNQKQGVYIVKATINDEFLNFRIAK